VADITLAQRAALILGKARTDPGDTLAHAARGRPLRRYLMNCSLHVRPFIVVAEQRGDTLVKLRNELLSSGGGVTEAGGTVSPPASLGTFRFDRSTWPGCPHCNTLEKWPPGPGLFWACGTCQSLDRPALNCAGCDSRGQYRCACGNIATAPFRTVQTFAAHGLREPSAGFGAGTRIIADARRSPSAIAFPPTRRISSPSTGDATGTLRLPWKR
jgi:hypothetical protein